MTKAKPLRNTCGKSVSKSVVDSKVLEDAGGWADDGTAARRVVDEASIATLSFGPSVRDFGSDGLV